MKRSLIPPPEPALGEHRLTEWPAIAALAQQFLAVPVPTLYELVRVDDPTGVSGLGRVASGVIFPYGGGAVYRWHAPRPPAGWPSLIRQFGVFDSIAEVLAVHGHLGATILRTMDATDIAGVRLAEFDRSSPEVFAVRDESGDVPEWGVWYPHGDRAITWAPPITPISGRRQADRHTIWRSMAELTERAAARTGPGRGRVVWLTSHTGRALVRNTRAAFTANMRHAEQAYELAVAACAEDLDAGIREQLDMPPLPEPPYVQAPTEQPHVQAPEQQHEQPAP